MNKGNWLPEVQFLELADYAYLKFQKYVDTEWEFLNLFFKFMLCEYSINYSRIFRKIQKTREKFSITVLKQVFPENSHCEKF